MGIFEIKAPWYNPRVPKCRNCIHWNGPETNYYNECSCQTNQVTKRMRGHNYPACKSFCLIKKKSKPKPMTNFERITQSPEKLAELLSFDDCCPLDFDFGCIKGNAKCCHRYEQCWLDWLKMESEVNDGNNRRERRFRHNS